MILSCTIIVKDDSELSNLKRCVASVINYVDEVVITANGEEVKEIAKYYQMLPDIKYFYHPWTKDFA